MAKQLFFNDKEYSIDESSLTLATNELKTHLTTVMNGTGAVINFDDIAYSIDSEKLQTATNAFVSHLGTITGSGCKVTVNGVEYSVDSTKVAGAVSELQTTFGNLSGGSTPDTPTPDEERLEGDGAEFYTLAPTALSFRSTAPLDEFRDVKVNGETVDTSNYTLEEGSTIVTLSIDYLQTLDATEHTISVVSDSQSSVGSFYVTQPELNEYGFYWNQPYVGYHDNAGQDIMFMLKDDGSFQGVLLSDGYDTDGSYSVDGNQVMVDGWQVSTTFSASNDGKTLTASNGEKFNLDESFVSDGEFMYILNGSSYKIRVIDREKSSYGTIKTGIYGKETKKIDEYSFGGNANLTKIVIPESINEIGEQAFNGCTSLNSIIFEGTMEQWNKIYLGSDWNYEVPATNVQCSDGTVEL